MQTVTCRGLESRQKLINTLLYYWAELNPQLQYAVR